MILSVLSHCPAILRMIWLSVFRSSVAKFMTWHRLKRLAYPESNSLSASNADNRLAWYLKPWSGVLPVHIIIYLYRACQQYESYCWWAISQPSLSFHSWLHLPSDFDIESHAQGSLSTFCFVLHSWTTGEAESRLNVFSAVFSSLFCSRDLILWMRSLLDDAGWRKLGWGWKKACIWHITLGHWKLVGLMFGWYCCPPMS